MPNNDASPIRLLHLSDLHFRAGTAWDSDPVLRALAQCIGADVRGGLAPDLVAITGDLAFAGKAADYGLAADWLSRALWPLLPAGLPRDRLLLVPGNHDADRGRVGKGVRHIQDGLLAEQSQDAIAELLGDDAEREIVLKRHADYLAFYRDWLGEPQALPWWQRTIAIRGRRLHLAGLDSAWMACGDADRGRLLLGRYQINQTVLHPDGEGADWRLALLHHPWDYLAEFDTHESRQLIHLHRDLVLRGHLHEGEASFVRPPDPARACLELAAGCVYDGSRHPNAFQWIELWPQALVGAASGRDAALRNAPRRVRVLYRTWIKGAWQIDRNQPGCPDGTAEFPLATPTDPTAPPPAPQAPAIPPAYLAWLRRTYSGIDLLGQDTQQGQAVTLSQVYCPAVTTPAAAPAQVRQPKEEEKQPPTLLLQRIDAQSLYCPAPPGAGKTTFCRWAVLQSIPGAPSVHAVAPPAGFAEPAPAGLRTRLPLLVPLREFWEAIDCGQGRRHWCRDEFTKTLAAWVDDRLRPDGLDGDLLKAHLRAGSAFLLLDGLDEVPVSQVRDDLTLYPRALLLAGLADALPHWHQAGNRILLTSRPYGLDEGGLARLGLPRAPLEPLPEPLQELFVTRWFHTLDKADLTAGLLASIAGRADLAPLAENPLLLTALCVIYGNGRRLPEDRYHLYQRILDNVLYNRYPGDARSREPLKARLEAIAHGMHTGAGLDEDRRTPSAEASDAELERLLRAFARLNPAYESGRVEPAVQREELLTRSGLLLPRPGRRAAFYHLSFQEFLAAERIARTSEDRAALDLVFRDRGPVPEWRPTLLFLFAAGVFNYRSAQWGLDLLTQLSADLGRAGVKANPAPAVLVAVCLDLCLAKGYAVPDGLAGAFRQTCLDAIADEIAIPARQALGLCLGRLGDPRILDLRDPAAYVEVPAGDYVYGDKNEPIRIETPFRLARYPTTNSQYRAFMEDGGYDNRAWWSDEGWGWLQEEGVTEPLVWSDRRWNGPNQPVVGVSFWEADACCRWAGGRLPREQEWEAAARGPDGCEYPWCGEWEDGICNGREAGLGVTSPVGSFPRSRQARLALDDLAGNCWEWCDDFYFEDIRDGGSSRVLRGGAFNYGARNLRASNRDRYEPEFRFRYIGFRCVLAAPRQP
jgi:predicted MPP superfamily phosphohydrolase